MRFARYALLAGTIVLCVLETIRRWDTWREFPLAMFDDYILGGIVLWVFRVTRRERPQDRLYMAALLGFGAGCAAVSTLSSFADATLGLADPSGLSPAIVTAIKAAFTLGTLVLLAMVVRPQPAGWWEAGS